MQYNKYALALVLLASSAFAAAVDFSALASDISTKVAAGKDLAALQADGVITADQATILSGVTLTDQAAIVTALTDADEKKKAAEALATKMSTILGLGTGKLSDVAEATMLVHLTGDQWTDLKDIEADTGLRIADDMLKTLLTEKADDRTARKTNEAAAKSKKARFEAVKKLVDPSTKKIDKVDDSFAADYSLETFHIKALVGVDLDDDLIEKILAATKEDDLPKPATPAKKKEATFEAIKALVVGEKLADTANLDEYELEEDQKKLFRAGNLTDDKIKEILKKDATAPLLVDATVDAIMAMVGDDKKLKDEKDLDGFKLTDAQKEKLKAGNLTKETVTQILAGTTKASSKEKSPEELIKEAKELADALAETKLKELATNIKAAIKEGKVDDVKDDVLETAGATKPQIAALRAVKDLKEEADILAALKKGPVAPVAAVSGTEINTASIVTTTNQDTVIPFYKQTWFIVSASALAVVGLGGGAYIMMSRQGEETDL